MLHANRAVLIARAGTGPNARLYWRLPPQPTDRRLSEGDATERGHILRTAARFRDHALLYPNRRNHTASLSSLRAHSVRPQPRFTLRAEKTRDNDGSGKDHKPKWNNWVNRDHSSDFPDITKAFASIFSDPEQSKVLMRYLL